MKTKKTLGIIVTMIIVLLASCGPSAEEKKKMEEKQEAKKIAEVDIESGVKYMPIDFDWDSGNGCIPELDYQQKIIQAVSNFKKQYPKMRINSWEIRYVGGGSSQMLPTGIWINFEPIQNPVALSTKSDLEKNLIAGTVSTPKGGSLCKTLGMTETEALEFCKTNHIKWWYEGKTLKTGIQPEDWFKFKVGKIWKPEKHFNFHRGHS